MWILIMIIFIGTGNTINQMEVLEYYASPKSCAIGMKKAVHIKMPVEREFRCVKLVGLKNFREG